MIHTVFFKEIQLEKKNLDNNGQSREFVMQINLGKNGGYILRMYYFDMHCSLVNYNYANNMQSAFSQGCSWRKKQ